MKPDIHPKYGKCIVKCACGATFETGSVKPELVDTGGRVDRFKKRYGID